MALLKRVECGEKYMLLHKLIPFHFILRLSEAIFQGTVYVTVGLIKEGFKRLYFGAKLETHYLH